jgi:hypothetical protein
VWFQKGLLEKVPAGEQTWTWTWGEVYYKRSTDGGATWGKDVRLTQPDNTACRPGVAADGKYVHVCWLDRRGLKGEHPWQWKIWYKRSDDGGATWGPDVRMSDSAAHARHPQIVATPGGQVCLIWEDGQVWEGGLKWSGDAGLWAAVSKDNGLTWAEPRRITFANTPHGHATHAKAYAAGRRIHLTWTDALPGHATEPIRAEAPYYTSSPDGGLTWQPAELIPSAGPHGIGEACAASGTDTWAIELLGQSGSMYVTTCPAER